jgi:ZIP family zinc transporter
MSHSRRWLSDCKEALRGDDRTSMWMIYVAVAVDLFSDGLMIGAGSAVATSLALVLALGQVLAV